MLEEDIMYVTYMAFSFMAVSYEQISNMMLAGQNRGMLVTQPNRGPFQTSSDANNAIDHHWVKLPKRTNVSHKSQFVSLGKRSKRWGPVRNPRKNHQFFREGLPLYHFDHLSSRCNNFVNRQVFTLHLSGLAAKIILE